MPISDNCEYAIIWEFRVRPEFQSQFEQVYGPGGDWVQLFRSGEGYLRTELMCDYDIPCRYVTIDYWRSRRAYDAFRRQYGFEYSRIDKRCEGMTQSETEVGSFGRL